MAETADPSASADRYFQSPEVHLSWIDDGIASNQVHGPRPVPATRAEQLWRLPIDDVHEVQIFARPVDWKVGEPAMRFEAVRLFIERVQPRNAPIERADYICMCWLLTGARAVALLGAGPEGVRVNLHHELSELEAARGCCSHKHDPLAYTKGQVKRALVALGNESMAADFRRGLAADALRRALDGLDYET